MVRLVATKDEMGRVLHDHPVATPVIVVVLDAFAGLAAWLLSVDASRLGQGSLVVGAILLGTAVVFAVLASWAFLTTPRRELSYRVDDLEERVAEQRGQILTLAHNQFGEPDQFVPIYHDLRADLRMASRKIEVAQKTKVIWGATESLTNGTWKKHKQDLGNHPLATADDVYGACAEAFGHTDRLNRIVRFGKRPPRPGDDLDGAAEAINKADARLADAIGNATPAQPS